MAREDFLLIPFSSIWSQLLRCKTACHQLYLFLLIVEIKFQHIPLSNICVKMNKYHFYSATSCRQIVTSPCASPFASHTPSGDQASDTTGFALLYICRYEPSKLQSATPLS